MPLSSLRVGGEPLPPNGPLLIAPNHLSVIDPLIIGLAVVAHGRIPRFLGLGSVLRFPLIGAVLRYFDHIPIDRGSHSRRNALTAVTEALHRGECVVVYPEGRLTRRVDLLPEPGHSGIATLASATAAPIVPVGQWGAQQVWRSGRSTLLGWPPRRAASVVLFGPPMTVGSVTGRAQLQAATDQVMQRITWLVIAAQRAAGTTHRHGPSSRRRLSG